MIAVVCFTNLTLEIKNPATDVQVQAQATQLDWLVKWC